MSLRKRRKERRLNQDFDDVENKCPPGMQDRCAQAYTAALRAHNIDGCHGNHRSDPTAPAKTECGKRAAEAASIRGCIACVMANCCEHTIKDTLPHEGLSTMHLEVKQQTLYTPLYDLVGPSSFFGPIPFSHCVSPVLSLPCSCIQATNPICRWAIRCHTNTRSII
jgi:hypothetical protein